MNIITIIVIYCGELNCKYYEEITNVIISKNEGKNKSKKKKI